MKIISFNINGKLNIDSKVLKEGTTIKARVLEVNGSNVRVLLESGELLDAKTLINLEGLKNRLTTFFIKSIEDGKLILSPANSKDFNLISDRSIDSNSAAEGFISKVLAQNNLENNEENILLIKTAINNKMSLTKENIDTLIKTLDKIEGLINIGQDERILAIKSDKSPTADSVMNLLKVKSDMIEYGKLEVNNQIYDTIKLQKPSDGSMGNIREDVELVDVTEVVHSKLEAIFSEDISKQSLINRVVLLTRLGMDTSLDNIEKLDNLIDKGEGIIKPLLDLLEFIEGDKQRVEGSLDENADFYKNIDFELIKIDRENRISRESIENFFRELKDVIEQLPSYIKSNKSLSRELDIRLNKFLDNLDLHSKMNTYYTFVHIPLKFNEEKENSSLIIVKKKNRQYKKSYSVYISLNTKNLKKVDVYCSINDGEIRADFIVEKEFRDYLSNRFKTLRKRLNSLGLNDVIINIREDERQDILNLFMENDLPSSYNLNIRV